MTDLATRPCACGQVMEEVIRADVPNQNGIRTGWYCPACRGYIEAVGRERIVQPEGDTMRKTQKECKP